MSKLFLIMMLHHPERMQMKGEQNPVFGELYKQTKVVFALIHRGLN